MLPGEFPSRNGFLPAPGPLSIDCLFILARPMIAGLPGTMARYSETSRSGGVSGAGVSCIVPAATARP